MASKFVQLQCLWKVWDSGTASVLIWNLWAARITTFMTTKDQTVLTRFVIMLALHIWVTVAELCYPKPDTGAK
ncbi:PQ-loop repeat-containing protein 3 [Fukomys damarensis]|uniref:PQ-loop repeat-containing protein 3 n=1 Tax=Fukomys damarensis TaxID=885580 RepID=A0A091DS77_FUKDA|nr:PQ-loop repeat-containing protein 3 [Fukomys damarensis]